MRRPSLTARQRAFAREQRALRQLARAAVRLTMAVDAESECSTSQSAFATANRRDDLEVAALKFGNTLNTRDRRRLSK